MRFPRFSTTLTIVALLPTLLSGCSGLNNDDFDPNRSFIDPSELTQANHNLVVPILDNLGTGIEEPSQQFANSTEVKPEDLVAEPQDYRVGRNDLIQIGVQDLVAMGIETQIVKRVSETGNISLPSLRDPIHAAGHTEAELEQLVREAYQAANILASASVTVTVIEARNRTFSVLGAVTQTGEYIMQKGDFRLTDAIVMARGVSSSTGIDYIYVIRRLDTDQSMNPATSPMGAQPGPNAPSGVDLLAPKQPSTGPGTQPSGTPGGMGMFSTSAQSTEPTTGPTTAANAPADLEGRTVTIDGKTQTIGGTPAPFEPGAGMQNQPQPTTRTAMPPGPDLRNRQAGSQPGGTSTGSFAFNELREPGDVRVIRIPYDPLFVNGELKYNIIIRPQDQIIVPTPQVGVYYMGGHVVRVGVYSLTAQKITLKQAVIGAGMLDQLAIPGRTQIIRRIGGDKEVCVRVDLGQVFAGQVSDIYLKPDDVVTVGTNAVAPFLAALRGGFRMTYGFGFLYDRNFAGDQNLRF